MPKPVSTPAGVMLAAAGGLFLTLASCGSPCPFGALARRSYSGEVACCGASARQDIQVPADVEVDVASASVPGQAGRVDVFLTRGDCDRLFDGGPYPPPGGTALRCTIILGPVAPGSVSARQKVSAGTYRLHLQAYSSNTAAALYGVDVVYWGEDCTGVVF